MFGHRSCGSSVGIVSDYRLDERGSIAVRGKGFFSSNLCVQTNSETQPASYAMGTMGSFSGSIVLPERDADHSLQSSVEVKNE
jgi:hypothetical protein